jgi:outer membrane protein
MPRSALFSNCRSRRHSRLLIALLWPSLLLAAQPASEPLTWEASVRQAAAVNPDLRAARDSLQAAEMNVNGAGSGFFPQIKGSVIRSDGTTTSTTTTNAPATSSALVVNQNLFAGFGDTASVAQARANRAVAEANLRAALAKLSYDLKTAFATLRYAADDLTLSADIVRRREQNLRLVELRYESGSENKGSLLLSQATLSQARLGQLQSEQALPVAQAQLARVLGRDDPQELNVVGTVPTATPPTQVDFARAVLDTPDQQRALAQVQAAKAGVDIAASGFWPSVDLTGTASRTNSDAFPDYRNNNVLLSLTVPIFSGGKTYYGVRSASAQESATQASRDGLLRQLRAQLELAYGNYILAVTQLEVADEFQKAAQVRAEIARNKYSNGLMSFEDWDIIENDLITRQRTLLLSQRDRIIAEAAWEQALGTGVIP